MEHTTRGNLNLIQQQRDAVTSCGMCEAEVLFYTSLIYSWSWLSVKTSARHGLPILWLMVYRSSLYKGFSCKQEQSEGAVARGGNVQGANDATSCSLCLRALSSGSSSSLKSCSEADVHCLCLKCSKSYSTVKCQICGHTPSSQFFSLSMPAFAYSRASSSRYGQKHEKCWKSLAVTIRLWYTL